MIKIIFLIIAIILMILLDNLFNFGKMENFSSNKKLKLMSSSKTGNNKIANNIQNNISNNNLNLKNDSNDVMFSNKDYNENLSIDNKDNKYYYDDMIDQSKINETSFNIIYSIDPIDYSDVKTGIQKCNKNCSGVCFENGYDGIATCYPKDSKNFDWGTLYKNPTFTYGYNAYGPENLEK